MGAWYDLGACVEAREHTDISVAGKGEGGGGGEII